ncbi:MAG: heterodisulfide reductase-related iron-sulfur binding cluster, partial [Rhodothermales bacterium]|nr:heterodisulfide reductase-related iron-sulfur binding cluster [Rhodothermales bacterium]
SEEVHEALDLCLSCKGCKGDCPVDVDIATYKAEFRAHYYRRRLRPREAYAFGWIHWWARAASKAPGLVNLLTRREPFAGVAKWAARVHPDRTLPRFADRTFRERFRDGLRPAVPTGRRVILWADTFKNFLDPEPLVDAARVLGALGYNVVVPGATLCCGRPLYDYGFLGMARKLLRGVLDALRDDIVAGVPVVGVEPSCVATFRDELGGLFPHDRMAQRLAKQTFLLPEFLQKYALDVALPDTGWTALLHGHCHQKAVLDFDADRRLFDRLGMDVHVPDSGCCGMAGPFGFEREHYDVSVACAERVLLPAVRARDAGTMVVTDGFSCREQIVQAVPDVSPLNSAQVLWRALERHGMTRDVGRPRQGYKKDVERHRVASGDGFATAEGAPGEGG